MNIWGTFTANAKMPNSEGPGWLLVVTFPLSVWCSLSSVRCDITHSEAVSVLHYSAVPPHYSPLSLSRHCTALQPALQLLCSSIIIIRVKTTPQLSDRGSQLSPATAPQVWGSQVRTLQLCVSRPDVSNTVTTFQILITFAPISTLSSQENLNNKIYVYLYSPFLPGHS